MSLFSIPRVITEKSLEDVNTLAELEEYLNAPLIKYRDYFTHQEMENLYNKMASLNGLLTKAVPDSEEVHVPIGSASENEVEETSEQVEVIEPEEVKNQDELSFDDAVFLMNLIAKIDDGKDKQTVAEIAVRVIHTLV